MSHFISVTHIDDQIAPQRKVKQPKAKTPYDVGRRKPRVKLADHGVTFERYKEELERGILYGYKPHFCYPVMTFNDVKDGLKALNYEDENGKPDPIMSIVNQDSIDKFQNLLISSNKAKMSGNTFVIDKQPVSQYDQCWLYNFI